MSSVSTTDSEFFDAHEESLETVNRPVVAIVSEGENITPLASPLSQTVTSASADTAMQESLIELVVDGEAENVEFANSVSVNNNDNTDQLAIELDGEVIEGDALEEETHGRNLSVDLRPSSTNFGGQSEVSGPSSAVSVDETEGSDEDDVSVSAHIPEDNASEFQDQSRMNLADPRAAMASRPKPQVLPIRVRTKRKKRCEFANLLMIQELSMEGLVPSSTIISGGGGGAGQGQESGGGTVRLLSEYQDSTSRPPLFKCSWSHDGNLLAAAGEDGVICVWKLIVDDVMAAMAVDESYEPERQAAIFQPVPIQRFEGHTGAVLDIAWSKNHFLLTSSMDRTVRLWHFSRPDCLGIFRHPDFVTSVAFHPRDDRLFVTGALDCRLRLWSIVERRVLEWKGLPEGHYITAVSFTHSGRFVLAGTTTGVCLLFEVQAGGESLSYTTQIHVHSRRGRNSTGKKICGIKPMPGKAGDEVILVSTNDSRVRLYTLRDKSIISKYFGHLNESSQIAAGFSDDAEYIVSGSEDGRICIWNVENRWQTSSWFSRSSRTHVKAVEYFDAHSKTVTAAVFAPNSVRHRLQSVKLRPLLISSCDEEDGLWGPSAGHIIVAVDLNGRIKVYENNPLLIDWLC